MNKEQKKYAIFWGCLIQLRLPWIEVATRKVLPRLGIKIIDLPFSCCPDPVATRALDHTAWLSLAARNLCLAEEKKLDILSMCSGCFETLKVAQEKLKDKTICKQINILLKPLGREYKGNIHVLHFQQWLYNKIGLDDLKKLVIHPISLKAAVHVGCHFTRPAKILKTDDPLYPEQLDELCEILGIETVDYPDKNLCCGTGVGLVDRKITQSLIKRKITGARLADADALIAHCPSCIQTFEMGQHSAVRNKKTILPVFHYLELLGRAMGLKREEFAFDEHRIDCSIMNSL